MLQHQLCVANNISNADRLALTGPINHHEDRTGARPRTSHDPAQLNLGSQALLRHENGRPKLATAISGHGLPLPPVLLRARGVRWARQRVAEDTVEAGVWNLWEIICLG